MLLGLGLSYNNSKTIIILPLDNSKNISLSLGGPAQNSSIFLMAPIPFQSALTCSTSSPHDILKVSKKQIDRNPPVGRDKRDE
jgi:hypothetical protein